MAETLPLLQERTDLRLIAFKEQVASLPQGRGSELGTLATHVIEEFEKGANYCRRLTKQAERLSPKPRAEMISNATQRLERLQPQLDNLHRVLATYQGAVARTDVPVGLQHLVDVLLEEVLDTPGDPIIHLDARNNYSTTDIAHLLEALQTKLGREQPEVAYDGRHPIAFNLPALDSGNVLLAPVLAHEVAHTAVAQSLDKILQEGLDQDQILEDLAECCSELPTSKDGVEAGILELLRSWLHELLCDAIALMLSGPSFLLAFLAFVTPGSIKQSADTHPPVGYRVGFALRVLDDLGWYPSLREELGNDFMNWFLSVSEQISLENGPIERFLIKETDLAAKSIVGIAQRHLNSQFTPESRLDVIKVAATELEKGLPMVQINERVLDPWEIVLAAWFGGIRKHGQDPKSIATIAGQREYNRLIVKTMEFSSIVQAWGP